MAEKISRKKLLKEPDEFISTTGKVIQYTRSHKRRLGMMAIILLAVIVAGAGVFYYFQWQEDKAMGIYSQAMEIYQNAFRKGDGAGGEKEGLQKAMEKFREAQKASGRGEISQLSSLYIGHVQYELKAYDAALAAYAQCLEGPFRAMALDGRGYCYEAKGDFAKALEEYQKNMDLSRSPFQGEDMLAAARCYEALNQKAKALEVYQKALAKNPKSRNVDFIQWKISELK